MWSLRANFVCEVAIRTSPVTGFCSALYGDDLIRATEPSEKLGRKSIGNGCLYMACKPYRNLICLL